MKRFLPGLLCIALPLLSYGQIKAEKPDESSELRVARPTTIPDRDHQFDDGSGIIITNDLSKTQIENLTTLGKVCGFLKYHHPKVTAGQAHWDCETLGTMCSRLPVQRG